MYNKKVEKLIEENQFSKVFEIIDDMELGQYKSQYSSIKQEFIDGSFQFHSTKYYHRLKVIANEITKIQPSHIEKREINNILNNIENKTEKEKKEAQAQFEDSMSSLLENFYKKIGEEESLFNLFDTIISDKKLNKIQIIRLNELVKDNTHFSLKCIIVSALMIRNSKIKLDEETLELLIDFAIKGEDNIWERALIGIIFSINGKENRISKNLKQKIVDLKKINRIQDGIYCFGIFLEYLDFKGRKEVLEKYNEALNQGRTREETLKLIYSQENITYNKAVGIITIEMRKYKFFEKIQYWLMPFYVKDNKHLEMLSSNCNHNIDFNGLMKLMQKSIKFSNIDKYSFCTNLNTMKAEEVSSLIQLFQSINQNETQSKDKVTINTVIPIYLEDK